MTDIREKAKKIVESLFHEGSMGGTVQRIQFMGGEWPDHEKGLGGFGAEGLTNFIEKQLSLLDTGWVSVEEPPEDGTFVDVNIKSTARTDYDRRVTDVLFNGDNFLASLEWSAEYVSHWRKRPLPPPPHKEGT